MTEYKQPISVLVVIHTPPGRAGQDMQVLLLERADHPGYWQSVTGSCEAGETPLETAIREVSEETGLRAGEYVLTDWQSHHIYEIYPHWRHRYAPGTTHNTEHVFSLELQAPVEVRLAPREHLRFAWLNWRQAADQVFSPSNRAAILQLAERETMPDNIISIAYDQPDATQSSCSTAQAWAKKPREPEPGEKAALIARIKHMLKEQDAVLVAHYYVHPDLQDLAEASGGIVSDSLDMANFGHRHPAKTIVVAGVRFMGETAKILNPEKRVLMPDLEAECSLDLGCPADEFAAFCDSHPDRTVVVYANTSAAVKARADWMVTSSIALPVVKYLMERGEKILWAPDRHLGGYVQEQTGADMLLWQASCIVHDEYKAQELIALKAQHPGALVLVHPESPRAVVKLADVIGSTTQLIKAAQDSDAQVFIVATDNGILHKMRTLCPGKLFFEAPTAGAGANCTSCSHCPWMAMNGLLNLAEVLETGRNEIHVDPAIIPRAVQPIKRMLDFAQQIKLPTRGIGNV